MYVHRGRAITMTDRHLALEGEAISMALTGNMNLMAGLLRATALSFRILRKTAAFQGLTVMKCIKCLHHGIMWGLCKKTRLNHRLKTQMLA
jgi:hypothetical protein